MMPFGFLINIFTPGQIQCPQSCLQFYYFPPNTDYNMHQNFIYSNLEETSLINSQFQDQNRPQELRIATLNSAFPQNERISRNEANGAVEPQSNERTNMAYEKQRQKFGRNIKSNIFGSMIRFVRKQRSLKTYVRKIIQKHKLEIKITDFCYMLNKRMKNLKAYVTEEEIYAFLNEGVPSQVQNLAERKEKQFRMVFRIVCKVYLSYYHIPYIYSTRKIKKMSKRLHLQYLRKF